MFGEAFAAEMNSATGETAPKKNDDSFVPLRALGPKWTVGGEDENDGSDVKESEEDSIFSKYVFGAVKGMRLFIIFWT